MGLLCSAAIIMQILEAPLPRPLPWMKPGLANAITLVAIVFLGLKDCLLIVTTRQIMANLLFGTFPGTTFLLGISGSLAAAFAMYALFSSPLRKHLGLVSISTTGAIASNLAQLLLASFLLGNIYIWYQLPVMLFTSVPAGILVGYLTSLLIQHMPRGFMPRNAQ